MSLSPLWSLINSKAAPANSGFCITLDDGPPAGNDAPKDDVLISNKSVGYILILFLSMEGSIVFGGLMWISTDFLTGSLGGGDDGASSVYVTSFASFVSSSILMNI